jgi:hypothetical protein
MESDDELLNDRQRHDNINNNTRLPAFARGRGIMDSHATLTDMTQLHALRGKPRKIWVPSPSLIPIFDPDLYLCLGVETDCVDVCL